MPTDDLTGLTGTVWNTTTYNTTFNQEQFNEVMRNVTDLYFAPKSKIKKEIKKEPIVLLEIIDDEEIMKDNKLSPKDVKIAACPDINRYYIENYFTRNINIPVHPINSVIHFNSRIIKNKKEEGTLIYGILLAYIIDNKITDISKISDNHVGDIHCLCSTRTVDGKSNIIKLPYHSISRSNNKYDTVLSSYKIKIKSGDLSGKVWGLTTAKSRLEGSIFKKYTIELGESKKIGKTYYIYLNAKDALTTKNEKETKDVMLKFALSDIEFIFPDIKGYNLPLNKTIVSGSVVTVKKKIKNITGMLTVQHIKVDTRSKRLSKNSKNRQLDIVMCATQSGVVHRIYAKNLKLVK